MNIQSAKQRYEIIGRSEKLDLAIDIALKVAATDLSVLIKGESGVGKEVFSKIIHEQSKRKHNKFFAVNCGAIPEGTINSELFGHEKGAFTGATSDRKGYFETVNTGTIFLDEIGEMPLDTQAYLLRILENGEFIKVGSSKVLKTDVRIVAATNVDLEQKIKKGKFREDLYYRLNTVPISVPALHERVEDIYVLFRKFANDFAEKYHTETKRLSPEARMIIERYHWPGNVRELRNLVEQISILTDTSMITVEHLQKLAPQILKRALPATIEQKGSGLDSSDEREILYKFLFDMKADLNDLKSLVYGLIQSNDLTINEKTKLTPVYQNAPEQVSREHEIEYYNGDNQYDHHQPIIINKDSSGYTSTEEVDENLSLDDKTKELIIKALKKHKNKRRDAAEDLGISERTLYRKIKEYHLDD